jgi:hypothetical protein
MKRWKKEQRMTIRYVSLAFDFFFAQSPRVVQKINYSIDFFLEYVNLKRMKNRHLDQKHMRLSNTDKK